MNYQKIQIYRKLILKYDYEQMKNNNMNMFEELTAYVFNPDRLHRLSNFYRIDFQELVLMY